jgi:hypothetical protein
MENYFIEDYDSYNNGYNLTLGGEGTTGLKRKPFTMEHRKKLSIVKMGRKRTKQELLKFSETMTGRKQTIKHVNNRSKKYVVTNEKMCIKMEIINLNKFCRENKLSCGAMTEVAQGHRKQHNGWKCCYL